MWRALPEGWLCRTLRVEGRGRLVGRVVFGTWRERGALEIGGRSHPIHGEGFWRRSFVLSRGGERIALARPVGPFCSGFRIEHGDAEYSLQRSSLFARSYSLARAGRELARIRPGGLFQRVRHVDLDDDVAPELALFALWLVALQGRRAVAAAG